MSQTVVYAETLDQLQHVCERYIKDGWKIRPGGLVLEFGERVRTRWSWFSYEYDKTPTVAAVAILEKC